MCKRILRIQRGDKIACGFDPDKFMKIHGWTNRRETLHLYYEYRRVTGLLPEPPAVTEDIKWENNLVFSVGGKMFCLADLDTPLRVSFKVPERGIPELTSIAGIIQAPYFARMMWVLSTVVDESILSRHDWEKYLRQSYELVKSKLPKRLRESVQKRVSPFIGTPFRYTKNPDCLPLSPLFHSSTNCRSRFRQVLGPHHRIKFKIGTQP